jgi:hypothetical protein
VKAGHCTACEKPIWKIVEHPYTGAKIPLWPRKDSMYVQCWTPSGYAPGIGYCPACCPDLGSAGPREDLGPVIGYETARGRYQKWYTDQHGEFLRAWLRDAMGDRPFFDDVEIERIMQEWERERTSAEEIAAAVTERDDGRRAAE